LTRNNRGCAPSRAFREGALPNCRHLTLRCPEAARRPFSSHFSCTALTDTQSQLCKNSPAVQHQELRPSPERRTQNPPQNHFGRLFDNMKTSSKSGQPARRKVQAKPRNLPLSRKPASSSNAASAPRCRTTLELITGLVEYEKFTARQVFQIRT
jgi:hypothetical protein